jgi:deoxyribose-phosphate aldolase
MELNRYIDHTLLRSDATPAHIDRFCRQAMEYNFHCVVVNPVYVSQAAGILEGSGVKICSVAGFPLGASLTEIKIAEAAKAEEHGAREIDVVANIGWIQSGRFSDVAGELTALRRSLTAETILKVIMETPLVSPEHWRDTVEAGIGSGKAFGFGLLSVAPISA